nr:2-oxo acid dehydrogenase subunit E2 [Pseudomonas fluorescens]
MTILTSQTVVGIDIAKVEIVVYRSDLQTTDAIKNDRTALKRWLKTLPAQSAIAVGRHWRGAFHADHQRTGSGDSRRQQGLPAAHLGRLGILPRLQLPLSLSWDHRAVDGAEAGRFLAYWQPCWRTPAESRSDSSPQKQGERT